MKYCIDITWDETTQRLSVDKHRPFDGRRDSVVDKSVEFSDSMTLAGFLNAAGVEDKDCRRAFREWAVKMWAQAFSAELMHAQERWSEEQHEAELLHAQEVRHEAELVREIERLSDERRHAILFPRWVEGEFFGDIFCAGDPIKGDSEVNDEHQ